MPAGRPTLYTKELSDAICAYVATGTPESHAALANGIEKATLCTWKKKYPELANALKRARSQALHERLARIAQAGKSGTWQADAWYLERQFCEEFGLNRIEFKKFQKAMIWYQESVLGNRSGDRKKVRKTSKQKTKAEED